MQSLSDYQKFWDKQFEHREKDKQSLLESLQGSAVKAAQMLAKQFKVKKVYLFGSAATGSFFHKHSDVDLAVEGLPPRKYFSALSRIHSLFGGGSQVDLLPLEEASPKAKKQIEKNGKLLYG